MEQNKSKAVFLDRDGTIIEHVHHLTKIEQVKFINPMLDILAYAQEKGFKLIMVTNQSVIGRNMLTETKLKNIHNYIQDTLRTRLIYLTGIYYCPHLPDGGCECRKPKAGLLLQAAEEHNIDLSKSIMIGDNISDIYAGYNANCLRNFLVDGKDLFEIREYFNTLKNL